MLRTNLFKPRPESLKTKNISFKFDEEGYVKLPTMVWRADQRPPNEVEESGGFLPKNTHNENLRLHVEGCSSNYIPTGTSLFDATRFCRLVNFKNFDTGSFIYKLNLPEIYVDPNKSFAASNLIQEPFGQQSFAYQENEIASVGKINFKDINAARKFYAIPGMGWPCVYIGDPYINPAYEPRSWAIRIPSANKIEAKQIEKDYRERHLLADDQRFISLEEAESIAEALRKHTASGNVLNNDDAILKFETLPKDLSPAQSSQYAINEYDAFAAKYKNPMTLFANKAKPETEPVAVKDVVKPDIVCSR